MPWQQILAGLIGAIFALALRGLRQRWREAGESRALALALWEELSAVEFAEGNDGLLTFGGFSSQVFDTLFADIAHLLPEDLGRQAMRYHWRMKYLDEQRDRRGITSGSWQRMARKARDQYMTLRSALKTYAGRGRLRLFLPHDAPQEAKLDE